MKENEANNLFFYHIEKFFELTINLKSLEIYKMYFFITYFFPRKTLVIYIDIRLHNDSLLILFVV